MALTIDELQSLLKAQDLKYFIHPEQPALMVGVQGNNGTYQFIVSLQENGEFLQLRTLQYLYCKKDDPHLATVLQVIAHLNYAIKINKWGWDPTDGEINVCADVSVEDGTLTEAQFKRILFNYLTAIDVNHTRLKAAVDTGEDPGEVDPMSGLPAELREMLERLRRAAAGEAEETEEQEDFAKI